MVEEFIDTIGRLQEGWSTSATGGTFTTWLSSYISGQNDVGFT